MKNNDMSEHFMVKDKNSLSSGVSSDKSEKFKKTLDTIYKLKTRKEQKKIDEMIETVESKISAYDGEFVVDVCFKDTISGTLRFCLCRKYKDIISIPLDFDIGYLKEDALENQKENVNNMFLPWGVSQKECDEIFDKIKQSITKTVVYAKKGASLRIWNDNTPTSLCGMYYLINLLSDIDCKIYEVSLKADCKPNSDDAVELTKEQLKNYSLAWDSFVEENAPLRVFENGILTSVDETYYDDLILNIVNKKKMSVSKIVGEVLSENEISDIYIFDRIYHLINCGYLEIVGIRKNIVPDCYPYKHIVKKKN